MNLKRRLSWIVLTILTAPLYLNCSPGFEVLNGLESGSSNPPPVPGPSLKKALYIAPEQPFDRLSQITLTSIINERDYENFWEFAPKHPLYSHGSDKRRWIYLPSQSKINNADPDGWTFPPGTVLLKDFSLDGRRIETRVFEKILDANGFAAWRSSVYLWRATQTDADRLTAPDFYALPDLEKNLYEAGLVADRYRIVQTNQCTRCHTNSPDVALGFNLLQLSNAQERRNALVLSDMGLLSNNITTFETIPGSEEQKMAIGYIQTNCAPCHNGNGPGPHNFRHRSTMKTTDEEAIIISAKASAGLITPGNPAASRVFTRFSGGTMPPGTLIKDPVGEKLLSDWISTLVFE